MTNGIYIATAVVGCVAIIATTGFLMLHASAVRVPENITTADLSLFGLGLAGMLIRRTRRC